MLALDCFVGVKRLSFGEDGDVEEFLVVTVTGEIVDLGLKNSNLAY